ncbi:MAG: hypothetical protein IT385_18995 [Deltaproteobacteria bacterium]|nr:hypothetical protein [Deltaproteobacteria bacterium]
MAIVSGDVNVTVRIDGAGDGAKFTDTSTESIKRLGAEATTLEKKISELTERATAFKELGLGASPTAQQNAKSAIALIERQTTALQTELAELHKLGAAQGPLGQMRQLELRDLEKKREHMMRLGATTSETVAQSKALSTTFAEGIKPVNAVREGFEKLRSNFMFVAGAIGAVVTVATTLWALLSGGENPIPQFIVDTEKAAAAEYELAKQLMQTVAASEKAAIKIDAVRVSTLRLAAANAAAAGDQKRQAELLRSAGVVEATATAADTQKSIDEMFARRQALNKAEQEAIAREKSLRAQATSAFGLANLPGPQDMEARGRAHAAAVNASVAAELASVQAKAARAESESITTQLAAQNDALKAQRDAIAAAADTTITLDETLVMPKAPGDGGGGRKDPRAELRAALLRGDQRAIDAAFSGSAKGLSAANDNTLEWTLTQADAIAKSAEQVQAYSDALERLEAGNQIRDFAVALNEALPGMGAFNVALSQLADTWAKWGEGSLTTRDAVIGSLGAIAKAGAQQIKDERLRAGVLSIIELGLGFANLANPPIAAGHFTASAILGGVALFGSGSGSSRGAGGGSGGAAGTPRPVRLGGEMLGQRAVHVTIQNYYGGRSEQEAGADFTRLVRRVDGTGHERGREAA